MPFILPFLILKNLFYYGEQFYNNPELLSSRHWTRNAKWLFRNYNELLHYKEKEYDNVVNEMSIYLNNKKIKKKFIYYLPKYTRLANKYKKHPEVENLNQIKNLVRLTANKYNFVFIDGADFFHNRNVPLNIFPYKVPTHYNETGYKLLAEHINIFIAK